MALPDFADVGLIGTSIYFPLMVLVLVRCYYSFKFGGSLKLGSSIHKQLFHVFLLLYFILEVSYLMSLATDPALADDIPINSSAFFSHIFAMFFDLVVFSIVIHFWTVKLFANFSKPSANAIIICILLVIDLVILLAFVGVISKLQIDLDLSQFLSIMPHLI